MIHLWREGGACKPGLNIGMVPPLFWDYADRRLRVRNGMGPVAVLIIGDRKWRLRLRAFISPHFLVSSERRGQYDECKPATSSN